MRCAVCELDLSFVPEGGCGDRGCPVDPPPDKKVDWRTGWVPAHEAENWRDRAIAAEDEVERLREAMTTAIDEVLNGTPEEAASILRAALSRNEVQ